MKQLQDQTVKLADGFETKFDVRDYLLDLMEEVGELSQAVQIESGRKVTHDPAKVRTKEDVIDGLCDVLFDVIMLSERYGIDLETEYLNMLNELQQRIDGGEFDKEEK